MISLVTGGAGFIGSHLVDALLAAGHEVVIIDDLSGGFREHLNLGAAFYPLSVCDSLEIDALFARHSFDYVFHCAASGGGSLSHHTRRDTYTTNVVGSATLINAAVHTRVKRFVFASSASVYGSQDTPFRETDVPQPSDPLAIAKYAVELDLKAARELFGLDHTIIRLHNVYGTRVDLNNPYHNVVGVFMRQVMTGKPVTIYGDGRQTRAFSEVGDIIPLMVKAATTPNARNEIINVGGDAVTPIATLAQMVARAVGKPIYDIQHLPTRLEVKHSHVSHTKANKLLKQPKPTTALTVGLVKMAEWARTFDFAAQTRPPLIEVSEKMPQAWARRSAVGA